MNIIILIYKIVGIILFLGTTLIAKLSSQLEDGMHIIKMFVRAMLWPVYLPFTIINKSKKHG